ncbi:glycogen debranching N-terminal domain-containing protein [Micromonospora robiginosa]|uniref:Glycogen debranching N-terminal domain-containing protein n=1 Tax=Micromonospora robiginosa TaxID=2749844 RepID=A0A7L6BDF2_9ACTN|nr:glycogen debranching N-terminal domain-containing protein [Micromonospora ferruginea]QLQ39881.2 glycogen debranching N-terminal domain-containing protein [Micromonospora ferruginea]
MTERHLQPLLHDLVGVVHAPTSALGDAAGQLRPHGVQGVFHADARVLSRAELRLDGREPEPIAGGATGPHDARFVGLARWLGDPTPDPTVRVERTRQAGPSGLTEEIVVSATTAEPVRTTVTVDLACDLAPIEQVKIGRPVTPLAATTGGPGGVRWAADGLTVTVTGEDATVDATDERAVAPRLSWPVTVDPGTSVTLRWRLAVTDPRAVVTAAPAEASWAEPRVDADDRRLLRLLDRSLADLRGLRLAEPAHPEDVFLGAGVPWFLTLFGRDSLWAARMMLPLGTDLAAGTLRVLARRQGTRVDPATGEQPGKILHELRRHEFAPNQGLRLPPAYYGTVDATMLWVDLLHDAWRWGLPADQVEPLLPHLEAALRWLDEHADADGDGFVEYVDTTGHGLANQGWKDSGDAVRFRDGRLAAPPIVLAEVQGYAYQAATDGANLLDAFGRPGADRWRDYADRLAERFRSTFWVDGRHGPQPALALDRDKRPVDSLTSNIGHLLGTGLLSDAESAQVAALLSTEAMAGGFGLRTMSTDDAGFSPLSYHCGSIWAHDTAIVLAGLARDGHRAAALRLADGLLTAAEAFDYRLPELYGGDDRAALGRPVPYPAACRPQAWSAAAAVLLLQAGLGVYPDVPNGRVDLRPLAGPELGALSATGLRIAGTPVTASVDHTGHPTLTDLPPSLKPAHIPTPAAPFPTPTPHPTPHPQAR